MMHLLKQVNAAKHADSREGNVLYQLFVRQERKWKKDLREQF